MLLGNVVDCCCWTVGRSSWEYVAAVNAEMEYLGELVAALHLARHAAHARVGPCHAAFCLHILLPRAVVWWGDGNQALHDEPANAGLIGRIAEVNVLSISLMGKTTPLALLLGDSRTCEKCKQPSSYGERLRRSSSHIDKSAVN